jgi:hypothetical protein
LKQSLSLPNYRAEFARGAANHTALAFARSASDVLRALAVESPLSPGERNAIVRALVLEKRVRTHPLWPALLLLAFEPAMRRLRLRLSASGVDDLDEVIQASLLGAAATVRTDGNAVVLRLHRAMARAVFKHATGQDAAATEETLPPTQQASIPWHEDQEPFVHYAAREVVRISASIPGATTALFVRARFVDVSVGVEGEAPSSPEERQALRHRLHVRNSRALVRLRAALETEGIDE